MLIRCCLRNKSWKPKCVGSFNMDWRILVYYPETISANPSLNSKHILASMTYFDSDMSKSTNTVVYFDWKTVIYIYVCGKCRTQFMLPMEKSVSFTGACANEIIPNG